MSEQRLRQQALDGMAVYLARNKTTKELDGLLAVAATREQKAIVRFAKKLRRYQRRDSRKKEG